MTRIPNTIETKFASASAGKVFVAVGILQLIEQGKLQFDDTLGTLLDIPLNKIDRDVMLFLGHDFYSCIGLFLLLSFEGMDSWKDSG